MKITVVPAQITTVEDRIIGSLGFSQILLLVIPIFVSAAVFAIVPPFMVGVVYKYVIMCVVALIFCVLAVRIKGKIVASWLVTILRYNVRPKYYLFNKNVTTLREDYPNKKETKESKKAAETKITKTVIRHRLDIPATAKVLAAIENPAAKIRFETGKNGNLHVRLTEIEK